MLTSLYIRDYALIEELELEFTDGFTVLTGETGAGKSILVGALGFVLGDRADAATTLRQGAARAEASAAFDLGRNTAARQWLAAQELEAGGDCLVRRLLAADGRSKSYINGRPVALQALREFGDLLVDLHGQHEHQSLLRPDCQLQLLDRCGGHEPLAEEAAARYGAWKALGRELAELAASASSPGDQAALLRYQIEELKTLGISAAALREIDEEHRCLANADQLIETCRRALAVLQDDEQAIGAALARVRGDLARLVPADGRLAAVTALLDNAAIQLDEAAAELRRYAGALDLDPQHLAALERRLAQIHDVARKHRVRWEDLPALQERLADGLARLEGAAQRAAGLEEAIAAAAAAYRAAAARLSEGRGAAARELGRRVTAAMETIGMPGAEFAVRIEPLPEERFSAQGRERVEFMVRANPGQPARPLAKTASGGELSRISLAIQVSAARHGGIPALIFDEVDVGIGGRVAEIVGQMLRALGRTHQVLCVTHLAQVAALGDHHLQVTKTATAHAAQTRIRRLSHAQRAEEIARMLGGVEISAQTRAHAAELIERCQSGA